MTREPIFKCEHTLYLMLRDGSKPFDMRKYDLSDDRIRRLAWGHARPRSFGETRWVPMETVVSFQDKETGEIQMFEYQGMEFAPWAPGWCFLLLGRQLRDGVPVED